MVTNDPAAIGSFTLADDWIIVGSDGSVTDKAGFTYRPRGIGNRDPRRDDITENMRVGFTATPR